MFEIELYFNMIIVNEFCGVFMGWCNIDNNYRIVSGEFIVVIGVSNSGKLEWVDVLMCNLVV